MRTLWDKLLTLFLAATAFFAIACAYRFIAGSDIDVYADAMYQKGGEYFRTLGNASGSKQGLRWLRK
jgi:hypothetical protein